jgi:hypothetical protein
MRRAARLTRLLSEFVGSQEAGRSLPAPLSRYVAASAYAATQQAVAPCRSAWATSGSVARQTRSPGARAFVTAPALDEGPLRQFRQALQGGRRLQRPADGSGRSYATTAMLTAQQPFSA